mmetsp:Transcript_7889/g.17765  ORF Transcript_7889/g.17765 Transcript_7889/m.17765 type:complete len:195 (-) Transcript_7889:117-701(-)
MQSALILICLLPITTAFNVNPEAISDLIIPNRNDWRNIIFKPALNRARGVLSSGDFVLAPSHGGYSYYAFDDDKEGADNKIDANIGQSSNEDITFHKHDGVDDNVDDDGDQIIPFVATAVLITAVLASTVILERYDMNNPTFKFDIDMFIALKNKLDGGIQNNGDLMMDNGTIMNEVPSMFPGDQIVGAIFGPP